jgi:GntR family transcriptional regulator / MocR family aminotransferase
VVSALEGAADKALDVLSPQQGLHMLALLPKGLPDRAAAEIRAQAGIESWLLSETRLKPADRDGFILGFSGYETKELTAAAIALGLAAKRYLR